MSDPKDTPLPLNAENEDFFSSSWGLEEPPLATVAVWLELPPPIKLFSMPPLPEDPVLAGGLLAN